MERQDARFRFSDARVTRTKHLDKVSFITLICQAGKYPQYFQVCAFDDERHGLQEGSPVTLSGEISNRKNKNTEKYELQFIVRKFEAGDEGRAPRPRSEAAQEPQQAPGDDEIPF
jgi:hypothetical protein